MYIATLKRESGEGDLRREFGRCGPIKKIMIKDHFAFIDFESHESALDAIREFDGKEFIHGEVLKVQQSCMYYLKNTTICR